MARRAVLRSIALAGLTLLARPAFAGEALDDVAGTYNGSQMEVGTELRLEANGRYEYYLAYGALDEMSEGTWVADGDGIVLTSDPFKAPVFELVGTKPGKGSRIDVTLEAPQQLPAQLFSALLVKADRTATETDFEEDGLRIAMTGADHPVGIVLNLELYGVMSELFDLPPGIRSMQFRFVPNELGKVAFDHQRLTRDGDAFVLERFDRRLRFRKEAPEEAGESEDAPEN
jgi:hypothetical protein